MTYLNKIVAVIIFLFIMYLIRDIRNNKRSGDPTIGIENINTISAVFLLSLLDYYFFTTHDSFCEILPFFCRFFHK